MYQTISANKFTPHQLSILRTAQPGDIIKDLRVLKKLSLLRVLALHEHTGTIVKHVWGMLVRASYIDDAKTFQIDGVGVFHSKYFDGCFQPFLVKATVDKTGKIHY